MLLGLIRDGEGLATAVLQCLGLRLETVKAEVDRALAGFPKTLMFGEVPFTPQAKRVLELSIEEARQFGHNYIGTEHLLLGLMKEGQSIAAKILESLGTRLDEVRHETLALLDHAPYLQTRATGTRGERATFHGLVGHSKQMLDLFARIEKAAAGDANVCIYGEAGTGKELIARTIHAISRRRNGRLVTFNCAAVPESLAESQLFGHVRGAFTGAIENRQGVFSHADTGTLFIGELCELSPTLQAKLLRVIQSREFVKVGGTKPIRTNIRLVTATSTDPKKAVDAGTFRAAK